MADVPGGASGILRRDYMGKEADRLVTHFARIGRLKRAPPWAGRPRRYPLMVKKNRVTGG